MYSGRPSHKRYVLRRDARSYKEANYGTLLEITVRAKGSGITDLTIMESNAKNSRREQLELGSAQATVHVFQ